MEHVIAQKHGGATDAGNLALACVPCNQFKGTDLTSLDPQSGAITPLFHPRLDRWQEHFGLRGLFIVPKTPVGRVTVRLLQFNAPERVIEREWFAAAGQFAEPL